MRYSRRPRTGRFGPPAKPRQPARSYALWLLSRRDYTAAQLRDRMQRRGYEASEVAEALALLQSYRYQNDERYARAKAHGYAARYGNRRIAYRLVADGVARDTVAAQLRELADERQRAVAAIDRFRGQVPDATLRCKVWRYLAARGFSVEAIRAALTALESTA